MDKIFKVDDVPEENIILATKPELKEIIELKKSLHEYLNLLISKNSNNHYQLHFVFKLLMQPRTVHYERGEKEILPSQVGATLEETKVALYTLTKES